MTANSNAHQTVRFATATGTRDEASFRSYGDSPFAGWLQAAHDLVLTTEHGSCD